MNPVLQIPLSNAAGGALGTLRRHYDSSVVSRASGLGAPVGILAVNVAGSSLMGLLLGLLASGIEMPRAVQAFPTIGFLGGVTTFSSFSLDAALMIEQQHWGRAALCVLLSVALSVGGLFLGLAFARHLP